MQQWNRFKDMGCNSVMDITLFGNRFSGHTYKVALFLALTNTKHTYKAISLSQPRHERPEFFRTNARYNEVPLLLVDDIPFVQSNAILIKLSEMIGLMSGNERKSEVTEWLMWEQSRLGSSLPNLRYERKFIKNSEPEVQKWLSRRLKDDLDVLDQHLKTNKDFVAGPTPSIADCSLVGYLYWLDDAGLSIEGWPNVKTWLENIAQLPNWQHPDQLIG